jgi:hypothetical protein
MEAPIKLVEVPAESFEDTTGFVTRTCCGPDGVGPCQAEKENLPCGIGKIRISNHPERPEGIALRKLRVSLGLTLGDGARRLGIKVIEMSGLERGVYTTDWEEAKRRLEHEHE